MSLTIRTSVTAVASLTINSFTNITNTSFACFCITFNISDFLYSE